VKHSILFIAVALYGAAASVQLTLAQPTGDPALTPRCESVPVQYRAGTLPAPVPGSG
jgi:hypothetical protein